MREQTYPGSYEAHLRRRVKELEEETESLRRLGSASKRLYLGGGLILIDRDSQLRSEAFANALISYEAEAGRRL